MKVGMIEFANDPEAFKTEEAVKSLCKELIVSEKLMGGFHPEDDFTQYVTRAGENIFGNVKGAMINQYFEWIFTQHDNERVFEIIAEIFSEIN